jgi:trichothecene 3-O-acetyltransferase
MAGPHDLNEELSILGQQPGLYKLYTQLCFCFPLADTSSDAAIIDTLTKGLERLRASFPWLAGQVVNEATAEGKPSVFKIRPLSNAPQLVVKDLRDDRSITMATLRRAQFPISMLNEDVICPRKTISAGDDAPADVFLLQANFINGGLLLTVLGQHNVMDMTGQVRVMHLLSKACSGEQFTSEDTASGKIDGNVIPLLDDSCAPEPEVTHQIAKPASSPPAPPPKSTWAYFIFSGASLAALKAIAAKSVTSDYVSTDDALSAFIWQGVMRARLPRLQPTTQCTFARAIDPRRYLGIPSSYPGLVTNMTYHTHQIEKLIAESLGAVASNLRAGLDPQTSNIAYKTRALATAISRAADKSTVHVTATLDLPVDIMLSSWSKYDCYELDFGLGLGKPEAVRRPTLTPVESLLYLMPRAPGGEIAAAICLRDEDMWRLKEDEEFAKYGNYVG